MIFGLNWLNKKACTLQHVEKLIRAQHSLEFNT